MKKRITEFLLRVRHWLIKALGGYTEQQIYFPPREHLHFSTIVPRMFSAQFSVDISFIRDRTDEARLHEMVKERLAYDLAKNILDEGQAVIQCTEEIGPFNRNRIYRAKVYIFPASKAAKLTYE